MKIHDLITTTDALAALCERLAKSDFVTVDTEFMRENTYWPELCLVQIADSNEAAAIDPLAPGIDLAPLLDLLCKNEDVLKVFHAGGQDVEIVYNLTGKTPHPIFDTQIAMMAISQSEQIGYANLVESWLGFTVDKGAQRYSIVMTPNSVLSGWRPVLDPSALATNRPTLYFHFGEAAQWVIGPDHPETREAPKVQF